MNNFSLLILTFYIIFVIYVFYRMFQSLNVEQEIKIQLDRQELNKQLSEQEIESLMDIELGEVNLKEQLCTLTINIENKSQKTPIIVDWDKSHFIDFDGRSRRIIRLIPQMPIELVQTQAKSFIAPTKKLKESLTTEDLIKLNSAGVWEITGTLVDDKRLQEAAQKGQHFFLTLILQMSNPVGGVKSDRYYAISGKFTLNFNKSPWTDNIRWKPPLPGSQQPQPISQTGKGK